MRTVGSCLLILTWGHAHAGRPLSVEDANVNETGQGHVETWWAHSSAGSRAWTVAPAWSPVDGMELAAAFSRENPGQLNARAVQIKWRLTASQDHGCNWGALLGLSQTASEKSRPYGAVFTPIWAVCRTRQVFMPPREAWPGSDPWAKSLCIWKVSLSNMPNPRVPSVYAMTCCHSCKWMPVGVAKRGKL